MGVVERVAPVDILGERETDGDDDGTPDGDTVGVGDSLCWNSRFCVSNMPVQAIE